MIEGMDLINTCFATTESYHTIAYYSHLVPVVLGMFLSTYALFKTKFSKLAIVFFAFTLGFSLWLINDLVLWVVPNYDLFYMFWSWIDFVDIVFFVLGAYFFGLLARGNVSLVEKGIYVLLCVPLFIATITGYSVFEFNQPVCEALENDLLTNYRLLAEAAAVVMMLVSFGLAWPKSDKKKRIQMSVMLFALLLFFAVFAGTAYLSSITYVYEINLYGLFVLPLFLIILTFAITDLQLFQFRFVGTQILAYVLIIMVGSQLLFIQDSTSRTLSLVTLAVSLFLGILLIENAKREAQARLRIETLATELSGANDHLKELDHMKDEFLSIASHQLRAPIAAVRGYVANVLDGTYGKVPKQLQPPLATVSEATRLMASSIEDYLNISRIEQGRMKYEKSTFDVSDLVKTVVSELTPVAETKSLKLTATTPEKITISADVGKVKQVFTNLIDNAIKYTPAGEITVIAEEIQTPRVARITIKDSGVGIDANEIDQLFEKFTRARGANKVNTTGTGLGLYVAKQLVEGNGGKVSVTSPGKGQGSSFIVELPLS